MPAITPDDRALFEEIKADPAAFERLCDKARWERMTLYAVLREWGDPREWDKETT